MIPIDDLKCLLETVAVVVQGMLRISTILWRIFDKHPDNGLVRVNPAQEGGDTDGGESEV